MEKLNLKMGIILHNDLSGIKKVQMLPVMLIFT